MKRQWFNVECQATVRRGFPLTVRAAINPAEPDVGLPHPYIDDYEILTAAGRPAAFLRLTEAEVDDVLTQVFEADRGRKYVGIR